MGLHLQMATPAGCPASIPEFQFIEQLHGERSEMYFQPQTSLLPPELTVEAWAADRAVEQLTGPGFQALFRLCVLLSARIRR